MKLKKNDTVRVISGKDKGKEAKVEFVSSDGTKVLIKGVNVVKRHVKPGKISKEGGIVSIEKPIFSSRVMILCEKCKKPVRVGFKFVDQRKHRICRSCGDSL